MWSRRLVPALLLGILLALQVQLFVGRGSVFHVQQMRATLQELTQKNQLAQQVNAQLSAEVSDLLEGLEMIEHIARSELGMVKPNEIFVQYAK